MNHKTFALLPLAFCTAFGPAVMAADTDITFKGEVVENTCTPTVNGSANGIVALPPISSNLLSGGVGATAGEQTFIIDLAGCSASVNAYTTKAYFYQANAQDGRLNKNAADQGLGKGWQYEIRNFAGSAQIKVGTIATINLANSQADSGAIIPATGGNAQLRYKVRYYRHTADPLVPGTLDATATYVLFSS